MQEGPVFCFFLLFVFAGGNVRGATFEMGNDRRGAHCRVGAGGKWELPCNQRCGADLGRNV